MRILHVIHSLDPRSGGPSHSLRGLVRAQAARGDNVAVLATMIQSAEPWAPAEEFEHRLRAEPCFQGVELSLQSAYGRTRPWSRIGYSPACTRDLRARLGAGARRPEIVHIHGLFSHLTSSAARRAKRAGVPYILRPAGGLDPWCLQAKRRIAKSMLLNLLVKRELQSAACLHATSQAEADVLAAWTQPGKVRCISHGVDLPGDLAAAREAFLGQFPAARGRRCILFLGRLHAKKRPELLIQALHEVRSEFPLAMLIIAGHDDGHAAVLQQQTAERGLNGDVIFTGFLGGALKAGAFAAAEVFALPSRDENFGLGVVEAMAHGCAVLVTEGVGAREQVERAQCGRTVSEEPGAMVEGLRSLLREDARQIGRLGADYVRRVLSWDSIADQIDSMYSQCLRGGVPAGAAA